MPEWTGKSGSHRITSVRLSEQLADMLSRCSPPDLFRRQRDWSAIETATAITARSVVPHEVLPMWQALGHNESQTEWAARHVHRTFLFH